MYGKTNAGASTGGSNSGIEMIKLWENASPTSVFPANTKIALDLTQFQMVVVFCKWSKDHVTVNGLYASVGLKNATNRAVVPSVGDTNDATRKFAMDDTGLTFEDGATASGSTSPGHFCVPVYIYGIKGVK